MIQEKKNSKVSDVQVFYWLSWYLVYYLYMNECVNIMEWVEICQLVQNIFIKTMTIT